MFDVNISPCTEDSSSVLVHRKSDHQFSKIPDDHNYAIRQPDDESSQYKNATVLFWNIDGKNSWRDWYEKDDCSKDDLYQSDIIFFSETMSLHPFSSFRGKNFVCNEAEPTGGRPAGGLELYYPTSEHGKVLSVSKCHIVIALSTVCIIGIYYSPSLDYDDKVADLLSALSHATKSKLPIILGGDFNIREGQPDFDNLVAMLSNSNIVPVSDPRLPTFVGPHGSSTPDHIFCSAELRVLSLDVVPRVESFHRPHVLKVQIPLENETTRIPKVLDIEASKQKLLDLNASSEHHSSSELITKLNEILNSCKIPRKENFKSKYTHDIKVLRDEVRRAFQLYQQNNTPFFKEVYLRCRSEFRKAVFLNKKKLANAKISTLIEKTQETGVRALYSSAKRYSSPLSSQVSLRSWHDYFSNLYQSFDEPTFVGIPSVPTEDANTLTAPFTEAEIFSCLRKQSSKAVGFNEVSPTNLKSLANELTPLLTRIFNHIFTECGRFPQSWLTSIFFFLYKKGSPLDPGNYRSLAIEDPFLKIFNALLCARLYDYSERNNLIPEFQFGYRRNLSTSSATLLLKKCVEEALARRKRVYACFVDYKKAFDMVNRQKMCIKLQKQEFLQISAKLFFLFWPTFA